MKKIIGIILSVLGGLVVAACIFVLCNGGPQLIQAAFDSDEKEHIAGILYIVGGIVSVIVMFVGFGLCEMFSPSGNSNNSNNSSSDSTHSYGSDNRDSSDSSSSSSSSSSSYPYEYGTMRDEYGNETSITHNTITDTYTDAAGNEYKSDDGGNTFYKDDE